jgi:hypothetical protein
MIRAMDTHPGAILTVLLAGGAAGVLFAVVRVAWHSSKLGRVVIMAGFGLVIGTGLGMICAAIAGPEHAAAAVTACALLGPPIGAWAGWKHAKA